MSGLRRWWHGRSLRTRLVAGSVLPLAVALVVGTVALTAVFAAGRVRELDAGTRAETRTLVELARSGQLPRPLPVPAGSPLLAQVLDAGGTVLAASPSASLLLPLAEGEGGAGEQVRTQERPAYGDVPLRVRVTRAVLGGQPVRVVVAAPLEDVRRATQALRLVLVLVVPVLVVAATLLARVLVGSALRPVERLREAAERVAATTGEPHATDVPLLPVAQRDDEVNRLARTLNGVLARMQAAVRQQRAFVADAAHELRSPLASMRVQLDVARVHPDVVPAAELVEGLHPEVERLARLVDDLLLLARLEAREQRPGERVDLTALAGAAGPAVEVVGDRGALERLVRNLVDNAARHAATVCVQTAREPGAAVLTVDDDGPGIPPADRERVFDRWVRLDAGRSRSEGGVGLGLALVREIAQAHGGTAQVLDSPLGGARLRVVLPPAEPPR